MICIAGCGRLTVKDSENDSRADEILMSQKIAFICHYSNYSEGVQQRGFYIEPKGKKVEYDISEIVSDFWKDPGTRNQICGFPDIYKIVLKLAESSQEAGEECLSDKEVSKCYRLLMEMGDDYEIEEQWTACDAGDWSWYGVIDDGENEPKFILLSSEGDIERVNSNKKAQKILNILTKTE